MKKILMVFICLSLLSGCVASNPKDEDILKVEALNQTLIAHDLQGDFSSYNLNDFAFELFKQLNDENACLSPLSLTLCLGLVANGAQGETKAELEELLGISVEDFNLYCLGIINKLNDENNKNTTKIANSCWLNENLQVTDEYLQKVTDYYHALIYQEDLGSDQTIKALNAWVKKETNGLIERLFDKPFDAQTMAILINTLYFKALWAQPFDANATLERTFNNLNKTSGKTLFLHSLETLEVMENEKMLGFIKHYQGEDDVFIAIKGKNGYENLLKDLTSESFTNLLLNKENKYCSLYLPKFDISYEKSYQEILKNMGLQQVFTSQADLSALGPNLFVSDIFQKVRIKVDEEGTEAAAATSAIIKVTSLDPTLIFDLDFNEPFVYMVYNLTTNTITFMGSYTSVSNN